MIGNLIQFRFDEICSRKGNDVFLYHRKLLHVRIEFNAKLTTKNVESFQFFIQFRIKIEEKYRNT